MGKFATCYLFWVPFDVLNSGSSRVCFFSIFCLINSMRLICSTELVEICLEFFGHVTTWCKPCFDCCISHCIADLTGQLWSMPCGKMTTQRSGRPRWLFFDGRHGVWTVQELSMDQSHGKAWSQELTTNPIVCFLKAIDPPFLGANTVVYGMRLIHS